MSGNLQRFASGQKRTDGRLPRLMLAAPASGSGKTLITCGIFLHNRRKTERPSDPQAFVPWSPDHHITPAVPSGNFRNSLQKSGHVLYRRQRDQISVWQSGGKCGYFYNRRGNGLL